MQPIVVATFSQWDGWFNFNRLTLCFLYIRAGKSCQDRFFEDFWVHFLDIKMSGISILQHSDKFKIHSTISVYVGFALIHFHLWIICWQHNVVGYKSSKVYNPQINHKTEKCSEL